MSSPSFLHQEKELLFNPSVTHLFGSPSPFHCFHCWLIPGTGLCFLSSRKPCVVSTSRTRALLGALWKSCFCIYPLFGNHLWWDSKSTLINTVCFTVMGQCPECSGCWVNVYVMNNSSWWYVCTTMVVNKLMVVIAGDTCVPPWGLILITNLTGLRITR